jgi:hypothetical protein
MSVVADLAVRHDVIGADQVFTGPRSAPWSLVRALEPDSAGDLINVRYAPVLPKFAA